MARLAEDQFTFKLISPEKVMAACPAWQVTMPGEQGEFGVRRNHMALVASLHAGIVEIAKKEDSSERWRIFISGGFADVTGESCTVLAEEAVPVEELDAAAIEQHIANLKEDLALIERDIASLRDDLAHTHSAAGRARIERELTLARARLNAASGPDD